jgi:pyruvate dehydrogenase E1 component
MMETVDCEYHACKAFGGAYTREHFFVKYPETLEMVRNLSDDDIWRLNRGGHDPHKVYAAYHAAVNTQDMPTVILAKTVKGYGMGAAGESLNPTHQQKKLDNDAVRHFRDRFRIPIPDDKVDDVPYFHPGKDSPEVKYMLERRAALGGFLPQRRRKSKTFVAPELSAFEQIVKSTGEREISTTMAFVRGINLLLRDKAIGPHRAIVADEARTFGMEGMFRQIGIYAPFGQKYRPQDADQLMYYREDIKGQVLQEGISEPGAMSAWMAAATSYSISDVPMLPFYIYYSMFGFQRVGDLCWAAGDMRARGFLVGGTAGRTTLTAKACSTGTATRICSPARSELPPTIRPLKSRWSRGWVYAAAAEQEDVYYATVMNENYAHPEMLKGVEPDIIKGIYPLKGCRPAEVEPPCSCSRGSTIPRGGWSAVKPNCCRRRGGSVSAEIWSCRGRNPERNYAGTGSTERWNRHPESRRVSARHHLPRRAPAGHCRH